jgi:four helix bundle protein
MNDFRFHKLQVYSDAKILHRRIVFVTKNWPSDFYYLKDQVRRSSLSSVLNVAEGSGKASDKDFNRYIQNAIGSANETAACVDVALTEKLIDAKTAEELLNLAEQLRKKLGALSKTLKS